MINLSWTALFTAALLGASTMVTPPVAQATDAVTYRITSDTIDHLDVEYVDQSGRHLLQGVALPWHLEVTLADARGPAGIGAQIRADWRPLARPGKWIEVSIRINGKLLCQSTLDIGNATCYGNTPHVS